MSGRTPHDARRADRPDDSGAFKLLRTDVAKGWLLAEMAADPNCAQEMRHRNRQKACTALETLERFVNSPLLDRDEQIMIRTGLVKLRAAIAAIPA
jgi:hypothetical protein